ncbi:hypothetical protein EPUL_005390, partial [Erysiphe pulchra]
MIFSLVRIALTIIFVTKTASTDLRQKLSTLAHPVYYECGSWIVQESRIRIMLYASGMEIDTTALPFREFLYDLKPGYRKILIPEVLSTPKPIHHKIPGSIFYVIVDQAKQIVDVVAEMKNGHFIKCKRVDESKPEPLINGQNDYGFECGHDLFSHETVQISANLAQSNNGKNKLYHNPYHMSLYSPQLDYLIYPLSREKYLHYAGKIPENTYFVVISPAGEIIDVIAELKRGDFIKCVRTTKVPSDIDSGKNLNQGYLCGLIFFDINHMKRTAELAKVRKLEQVNQIFPEKYNDNLSKGFLFPLYPNGRFFGSGSGHQLCVLDPSYAVDLLISFLLTVKTSNGITPCELYTRGIEAVHPETDNFICGYSDTEFENGRLLEIIEAGCKALGTLARRYPAMYNGPAFNVHGPYVTWPIRKRNNVVG